MFVARAAMVTIEKARANFKLLFNRLSDVLFLSFHSSFTENLRPKSKF